MQRKIIEIDSEKCNGCGICAEACHESAIQMINGKAVLVGDKYCDGLGDCLPTCPVDAIKMVIREAAQYDQSAVDELKSKAKDHDAKGGCYTQTCPGAMNKRIGIKQAPNEKQLQEKELEKNQKQNSTLTNWPVQLRLVNPQAEFLQGSNLLLAADCAAFAHGDFHNDYIKGRVVLIGCPKLDDNEQNALRIAEILKNNDIASLTVVRMSVPCCAGIVSAAKKAMLDSQIIVPYKEVTIDLDGTVL